MYQPTDTFVAKLEQTSRQFRARITGVGINLQNEINSITITMGGCPEEAFTIGSVFGSYADVVLSANTSSLSGKEILIEFGLVLEDGTIEYVPMGRFKVLPADLKKTLDTVTLKASDRIIVKGGVDYNTALVFPATVQEVLDDIFTLIGVTIVTDLPTDGIVEIPITGMTVREVLGFISALLGGFCFADRDGNIRIAQYPKEYSAEISVERCFDVETSEEIHTVNGLTVVVSESETNEDGEATEGVEYTEGESDCVVIYNPYMTEALFEAMKSAVVGYSFYQGEVSFLGDPRLGPDDAVHIIGLDGETKFLPCMMLVHEFDGGLTTTLTVPSPYVDSGNGLSQQIGRLSAELAVAKENIIRKSLIIYTYNNSSAVKVVSGKENDIIRINYATVEDTRPMLFATIPFDMTLDGLMVFRIYVDGVIIENGVLSQYCERGKHFVTISRFFNDKKDARRTIKITAQTQYFESDKRKEDADRATIWNYIVAAQNDRLITDGSTVGKILEYETAEIDTTAPEATIAQWDINAILFAQGLATTEFWDGTINLTDTVPNFFTKSSAIFQKSITEAVSAVTQYPTTRGITEAIPAFSVGRCAVFSAPTDRPLFGYVIKAAIRSVSNPTEWTFEEEHINTGDGKFALRTLYTYKSEEQSIDFGRMCSVTIRTDDKASIEGVSVNGE